MDLGILFVVETVWWKRKCRDAYINENRRMQKKKTIKKLGWGQKKWLVKKKKERIEEGKWIRKKNEEKNEEERKCKERKKESKRKERI